MASVGVVVIGRNEGFRLKESLLSVLRLSCPVVYSDSHSADDSVALACSLGVAVVELDPTRPMNASRGRKEGFDLLVRLHPNLKYVMFLDGDCILDHSFIDRAIEKFELMPDVGVVFGRLNERHPEHSIYNRIANLEWAKRSGEVSACGGNALFRVDRYFASGGYNETIFAGEEPELCARIRSLGSKVLCIDEPMGFHDLGFSSFGEWWIRGVRGGYGALSVRLGFGVRFFDRQILSAWLWVIAWPLVVAASYLIPIKLFSGDWIYWVGPFVASLLPVQVLRIARNGHNRGLDHRDAVFYGVLMMINKWASFVGQLNWVLERWQPRSPKARVSDWEQDLGRYPKRPFLKEQSIWAIAVYRWGAKLHVKPNGWQKRVEFQLYWLVFRFVETLTGICLPHNAKIGPGLRIHHFGGIFVNPQTVLGANCTLRQGVTLGNRHENGGAPIVGNNVDFGAYAQVLGSVRIGDNAKIGAMSVVLEDVPAHCTVVGNPARVVRGGSPSITPVEGS